MFLLLILCGVLPTISVYAASSLEPPPLPVIRLRYNGNVYDGLQGSFCWLTTRGSSDGELATLCADTVFPDPSNVISVVAGETLMVEIEAHEEPLKLTAQIFMTKELPYKMIKSIELDRRLVVPLNVSFQPDMYIIIIFGVWNAGDISYAFKIDVLNPKD